MVFANLLCVNIRERIRNTAKHATCCFFSLEVNWDAFGSVGRDCVWCISATLRVLQVM
jgi:hypothetical protein